MKTLQKVLALMTCALAVGFLVACNTVQGIGKDVKRAGEVVEGAAKK
jgi:predicted small secreted protein